MTTTLKPGDRFIRQRNFKPAESGIMHWWLLSLSQEGATAHGIEIIEVAEIVESHTLGTLAIFRHWIVDPNGRTYTSQFAPDASKMNFRNEKRLRHDLKRMGLEAIGPLSS